MLAMGRALCPSRNFSSFDEPSMGLAPLLVQEIFNIIKEINEAGTTILLVEQNAIWLCLLLIKLTFWKREKLSFQVLPANCRRVKKLERRIWRVGKAAQTLCFLIGRGFFIAR